MPGVDDYNGDGHVDILLSSGDRNSAHLAVLPGNGYGSFGAPIVSEANKGLYDWSFSGDFNGDGMKDILANQIFLSVDIYYGTENGHFMYMGRADTGSLPRGIGIADLNKDGLDDYVSGSQNDDYLNMYFSNGDGTFSDPIGLYTGNGSLTSVPIDMNGDDNLDLVIAYNTLELSDGHVAVFLNQCGPLDCRVDLNNDTVVNSQDIILYLSLWATRNLLADWNHDNVIDTMDVAAFFDEWIDGCS